MTPKDHNRLVGIFLMIHGGIQAVAMALLCLIYGGIGAAILFGGRNGERGVGVIFIAVIAFIALFASAFVIPQIIGGYKLLKEKSNARIWGIIGSVLSCISFPLGTAAGVYGMWFLFGEEGKSFYLNQAPQPPLFEPHPQPPAPNSWQ